MIANEHVLKCSAKQVPCPNGCPLVLTSESQATTHFKVCPNLLITCAACSSIIKQEQEESHKSSCKSTCSRCNIELLTKDKDVHELEACPEADEQCQHCQANLKRKDLETHLELQCPESALSCDQCGTQYQRKHCQEHNCIKSLLARIEQNEKNQNKNLEELDKMSKQYEENEIVLKELQKNDRTARREDLVGAESKKFDIICKSITEGKHDFEKVRKKGHCKLYPAK